MSQKARAMHSALTVHSASLHNAQYPCTMPTPMLTPMQDFIRKKNKWLAKLKAWIDENRPGEKMMPYSVRQPRLTPRASRQGPRQVLF